MNEIKQKFSDLNTLKNYGIFAGIIILCFGLSVLFMLLGNKSWKENLKDKTENILIENGYDVLLEDYIPLQNGLDSSCAVYSVKNDDVPVYAAIVRLQTLYGPQTGVFYFENINEYSQALFVDLCDVSSNTKSVIIGNIKKSQIQYWENRLTQVLKVLGAE